MFRINVFTEVVLPLLLVLLGGTFLIWVGTKYDCSSYAEIVNQPTKVVSLTCYVNTDNGWITKEQYNVIRAFREFKEY